MDLTKLIDSLDEATYQRLKRSIETGRWPDGRPLSVDQRENSMLLVIAYESRHLPEEMRTGYIPPKKTTCDSDSADAAVPFSIINSDEIRQR